MESIYKGKKQLGGSDDEDLRVEIDKRKFPQNKNKNRYFISTGSIKDMQIRKID